MEDFLLDKMFVVVKNQLNSSAWNTKESKKFTLIEF